MGAEERAMLWGYPGRLTDTSSGSGAVTTAYADREGSSGVSPEGPRTAPGGVAGTTAYLVPG